MNPFELHTSSVFVICSPLQLLCAIATIRQLKIDDYIIIAYLPKGDIRNEQVLYLLKVYKLKYVTYSYINKLTIQGIKLLAIRSRSTGYSRLFVGDIKNAEELYIGYCYVKNSANIVCLDDGNGTIEVLKNIIPDPMTARNRKLLDYISKKRGLYPCKNLLTIYSDICNPKYNIKALLLNSIINCDKTNKHIKKDVFIIGTNVGNYCGALGISENMYILKLDGLMKYLRINYPDDSIYFIPHGREYKEYGQVLCKKNGCVFYRPKTMVEKELLDFPSIPKAIYGYTSAALFTLKKLFPEARVVNILFDIRTNNTTYKTYLECSDYYLQNGIELFKDSLN